ncbi:MAG: hypothetical protein ACE5I1_08215 [bacterium]
MGFRELLLVVFNSVLFSLLVLNINATSSRGQEALQETEIAHTAISIAQRFLEEAKSKKFDANVGTGIDPATFPGTFTSACCLGHHPTNESYPNFNDVDDYHNFNQTINVQGMDFLVAISVAYVSDTNPEQPAGTETFFKKMTVKISSDWLSHSITLKQVVSYFGVDTT